MKLLHGDCLELMKDIEDQSIDMILCDLPYGTTACSWDSIIPFEPLWKQYERIIKYNGAIVLFGSEPFSSLLRISNLKLFKYDWIWEKSTSAGFIHAKNMPLKRTENISVFSLGSMGHKELLGDKRMVYNPQDLIKVDRIQKRPNFACGTGKVIDKRPSHKKEWKVEWTNYPINLLKFARGNHKNIHPTQKPVALLKYLIKTYTNENEIVLDNCMGSGSTGVACLETDREFIGIEKDQTYFDIAQQRIANHQWQSSLF